MTGSARHPIDIIVLTAGTVDPLNTQLNRATSYGETGYWGEYPEFMEQLDKYAEVYDHLAVFKAHGWSGDNTAENRRIAGAYLANRLCGANGEKAYYAGYKKRAVNFHLVGHSHGGNVANEFTRRIATLDEWPEEWRICSITYLSTPFFRKLHQVDERRFSADCKILNVMNEYDLTQRVIADFSMYDLISAIDIARERSETVNSLLSHVDLGKMKSCMSEIAGVFNDMKVFKLLFDSASYKMDKSTGDRVYSQFELFLSQMIDMTSAVKEVAAELNMLEYEPSDASVKKQEEKSGRKYIDDPLFAELSDCLTRLSDDLNGVLGAVKSRHNAADYAITPLIGDIENELDNVLTFFSLDDLESRTRMAGLLALVVENQIEYFDDTKMTPLHQLGEQAAARLVEINLTDRDAYHPKKTGSFDRYVQAVEAAERAYGHTPSRENLLRLLITLIASQSEFAAFMEKIDAVQKLITDTIGESDGFSLKKLAVKGLSLFGDLKPIRLTARRLQEVLKGYQKLNERYRLDIGEATDKGRGDSSGGIKVGSLRHFAIVSHSVSRREFYPEVQEQLAGQIGSPKKQA